MAKVTGEGTVVQLEKDRPKSRCRRWQLRVPVGLNPRTGRYSTRTRRMEGTYTEAKKALRGFIAEIESDKVQARSGVTFEQECARLMGERRASGRFSENRNRRLESALRAACAHIGKADFAKVTPEMLDGMYAAMLAGDTLSGEPASGTYVRSIHNEVKLVYRIAVREGRVASNPADRADPPRCDSQPRKAMSAQQLAEFTGQLDVSEERDFAWWLAATLGLRRGEVCGLSWGDLDAAEGTLHVRHSFDTFRNLKETKTSAGRRDLPLTAEAVAAFAEHRAAQRARGFLDADDRPVVITTYGTRVSPDMMEKWWQRERAGLGAEGFCLHELRHSYLTQLARAGVHPKVMQELAGHATSAITMDIYTHVNMDSKREAAEALRASMAAAQAAQAAQSDETEGVPQETMTV